MEKVIELLQDYIWILVLAIQIVLFKLLYFNITTVTVTILDTDS